MEGAVQRGSSKLGTLSVEDLHKAIGLARTSYKIERWWKYGQPQIDRIEATLNVTNVADAGSLIDSLIAKSGAELQINLDVFPYGIPVVDGVRLEVNINPAIR
ncbi:MAG: hypothetical protein WBN92_12090 [Terriglobia bacterium]